MDEARDSFDEVAELYDEVRPTVPEAVVEALWCGAELGPGARVLEVGCGTGQLTAHLVARGADVVAVEPGAALADRCAAKLPQVTIVRARLEAFDPRDVGARAVVACQSAHWIAPAVFLERADQALTRPGTVGLIWHVDVSHDTPFYRATQRLYDRYFPRDPERPPTGVPNLIEGYARALEDDARFASHVATRWPWTRVFDAATYLRLLQTHSPVRGLGARERAVFLEGHRSIIADFGGELRRHYETALILARPSSCPPQRATYRALFERRAIEAGAMGMPLDR